jgi:uncharacterized protein (DUF1697 family)
MAGLKAALASQGLADVSTYVQSGNVVFRSDADPGSLSGLIGSAIENEFGFRPAALVLSSEELAQIATDNPFLRRVAGDTSQLYATFFFATPVDGSDLLQSRLRPTDDEFALAGRVAYLRCLGGYGRTPLSNAFFEKALGVPATTRNWKTVTRLVAMAWALEG